jgi:thiopeptide-type bacteriocin biosynthesis protein
MNEKSSYNYHEKIVFRTPLLSLSNNRLDINYLFDYSQNKLFKESIYLASPVLFYEMEKWHNGQVKNEKEIERLANSLFKYYVRMQSRCTPYGLFAACGTGSWGEEKKTKIKNPKRRHTRLDMNYLCSLAQHLNAHNDILPFLKFFPNNSIYVYGPELRYVDYNYKNNRRIHQLSSVNMSGYLKSILETAKNGASIGELINSIISDEITEHDASEFINELILNQILVSELEPSITGDEFVYQIISSLKNTALNSKSLFIQDTSKKLQIVQKDISEMDNTMGNSITEYQKIYEELKTLNIPIEENQLFQTDLYHDANSLVLNKNIQTELNEALFFLNKLFTKTGNQNLNTFCENYSNQYEDLEIPLLEALDTESGIGYTRKDFNGVNPLIDSIKFPKREQESRDIKWNNSYTLIQNRLSEAYKEGAYSIKFTNDDLNGLNNFDELLPDTIAVMFKMISNEKVYLQSCGGSSAANLLSRFSRDDESIYKIIQDIVAHEQNLNNEKIIAEIIHLPESRIGNILLRPKIRDYEIPYLGKSSLPKGNQIELQDLMISVIGGKVILRSVKLNKEIIPRLTSAHNYSFNALPVYQFLCDLQNQYFDKTHLSFSWGPLSDSYKFLPRVEYKNIILQRAKWQFSKLDFSFLFNEKSDAQDFQIESWRKKWQMPQNVLLIEADNELLIDFSDSLSIKMFLSAIRKKDNIILEEFLFDRQNMFLSNNEGQGFTNEFIAFLLKSKSSEKKTKKNYNYPVPNEILPRNFIIGNEWLYYKLYCGIKTADKLLSGPIKTITEILISNNWITNYFFIRYNDPDHHVRLRFHISDKKYIGKVIEEINIHLSPYFESFLINKIQLDPYKREFERYGKNSIELAEALFYFDSKCCINTLSLLDADDGNSIRWQFALRSIDQLMSDFRLDTFNKLQFMNVLSNSFFLEHGGQKELRLELDNKFRNLRKDIDSLMDQGTDQEKEIYPLIELLECRSKENQPIVEKIIEMQENKLLQVEFNSLLSSYVHMALNRIFMSRQRTNELIVYDLLTRFYKSSLAKAQSQNHLVN